MAYLLVCSLEEDKIHAQISLSQALSQSCVVFGSPLSYLLNQKVIHNACQVHYPQVLVYNSAFVVPL